MPKKCIVLDIESVPAHAAVLDEKGHDFALPIFHRIVCLSYAVLDGSFKVTEVGTLGLNRQSEEDAIRHLSSLIDKDTMIVTWSGRRFDMPVFLYRALAYGIPCPWYFKNEFDKRFTLTGHFDLQDNMMLFGAADKIRLDHAAAVIGLPGKMDVAGADVADLWARNRFLTIGTYCVTDVIQTAILFIRWAFLRGLATADEVNGALNSIASYPSTTYLPTDAASLVSVAEGIKKVVSNCDWDSLKIVKR